MLSTRQQHLAIAAAAVLLAGSAVAQEGGPASGFGGPGSGPGPAGALRVEAADQVPDKEKLSRATAVLDRLQSVLKDVLKSLEEARSEKDVVKLNCVSEKLTQIKGLLRVAEQSDIGLQEAVAKGDKDSAQHEYAKITIAKQRAEQLRSDAEQCIGQLAYVVDERTVVSVEIPDDLPEGASNAPVLAATAVNPPALSPAK